MTSNTIGFAAQPESGSFRWRLERFRQCSETRLEQAADAARPGAAFSKRPYPRLAARWRPTPRLAQNFADCGNPAGLFYGIRSAIAVAKFAGQSIKELHGLSPGGAA